MASKAIGFLNFKFGADLSGFDRAMKKAQKGLKKFGKSVTKVGQNLSTNLTLPIVALGAASLKTFADFEQGMLKVKAISGATTSEFNALTESAKELGSTTMFTASQVAELQLNLSKLGFDPESILSSSQAILNLAQATDSDLAEAATVAASTMNAFGLEAKDMTIISDVMADAFSSSALDLQKFQTAMASVAPVAKQAGADIQRTSAILGVLVNNGIEASSAGTALRNVFIELAIQGKTWDEAMNEITSDAKPLAKAFELFGKKGASVATIIANNGVEIQALTADFQDSAGEAQAMADIMDSGVGGAMRRMKSQLEGVAIELGNELIPVFQKFSEWVEKAVEWFKTLDSSQKKNIVKWGLILAAIGPVLIIIGKMSLGISALIGMFKGLAKWIVANPYIALAAGIALVVAQIGKLILEYDGLTTTQRTLNSINETAQSQTIAQQVEVGRLTDILKDENTTLEDKEIALKNLNEIAPEYYGKLNAAAIDVKALDKATGDYIDTLLTQAKVQAAQETLVDLMKEQIELQKQYKELTGTKANVKSILSAIIPGVGLQQSADLITILERSKTISKDIMVLTDLINTGKSKLNKTEKELNKTSEETVVVTKVKTKKIQDLAATTVEYSRALDPLLSQIQDYAATMTVMGASMFLVETRTEALTEAQKQYNATIGLFKDIMFTAMMDATNSQESFFSSFIEGMKKAIKQLLVQLAIMTAINILLGGPGISIGEAFSMAKLDILGFADGGIISGPTVGLMGEYPGAASNPEVVAPLDKLKSLMGTGNQNIIVEGRLVGNDIYLSNERTKFNRNRTV